MIHEDDDSDDGPILYRDDDDAEMEDEGESSIMFSQKMPILELKMLFQTDWQRN